MPEPRLVKIRPAVQHYEWGGTQFLPALLGAANPGGRPWAELWYGAHPKSPALAGTAKGTVPLDALIAQDPARWLGAPSLERFGPALLEAIRRGRSAPLPQFPARRSNGQGRPDPAVSARYDRLRAWRARRAEARGVDPDIVLNNEALMAIARACPTTLEALAALGILRPWKLEEYGPELLRIVAGAVAEV